MKLFSILALLISLSAAAGRTYHSNDGSARAGNPGTFTKEDANTIPAPAIQSGETAGVPDGTKIQKQEAGEKTLSKEKRSQPHQEGSLDMSTTPNSRRVSPTGNEVILNEEEEE